MHFYCFFITHKQRERECIRDMMRVRNNWAHVSAMLPGKDDDKDPLYVWVDKIQHYRNAVHAFNYRDIGTAKGFMSDMEEFYRYVNHILDHLPPIEDFLPCYPAGYVMNVYFD